MKKSLLMYLALGSIYATEVVASFNPISLLLDSQGFEISAQIGESSSLDFGLGFGDGEFRSYDTYMLAYTNHFSDLYDGGFGQIGLVGGVGVRNNGIVGLSTLLGYRWSGKNSFTMGLGAGSLNFMEVGTGAHSEVKFGLLGRLDLGWRFTL